jgi:hypothetical protein
VRQITLVVVTAFEKLLFRRFSASTRSDTVLDRRRPVVKVVVGEKRGAVIGVYLNAFVHFLAISVLPFFEVPGSTGLESEMVHEIAVGVVVVIIEDTVTAVCATLVSVVVVQWQYRRGRGYTHVHGW